MAAGVKRSFVSGRRTAKSASDVAANATTRPESSLNGLHNQVCRVHRALTARRRAFRNARGKEPARRRTNAPCRFPGMPTGRLFAAFAIANRRSSLVSDASRSSNSARLFGNPSYSRCHAAGNDITNIELLRKSYAGSASIKRKRIISFSPPPAGSCNLLAEPSGKRLLHNSRNDLYATRLNNYILAVQIASQCQLANARCQTLSCMAGAVDGVGCLSHHFLIGFELTVDLNHADHFQNNPPLAFR